MHQKILILDFGSQYTQLIARRVRELNVFCEIYPFNDFPEPDEDVKGIILSGSPFSVRDENAPKINLDLFRKKLPILGVCFGAQYMAQHLGGEVSASAHREYGRAHLEKIDMTQTLMQGLSPNSVVWMSHADTITKLPENSTLIASTKSIPVAAYRLIGEETYGIQFHPEVYHSADGKILLNNFLEKICSCKKDWTPAHFVDETIFGLKEKLGSDKVVMGLSGGVDSTVAAVLIHKAIGENLFCIFVNNGLLRKDEFDEVLEQYKGMGLNVKGVDSSERFYQKLAGVSDPETKRKIIGNEFIEVFDEESHRITNVKWLGQGTIYPDVIESKSVKGPSATIKSHHNVGGLPDFMKLKLVEPLNNLFKDEVRRVGKELEISDAIIGRHPFPGPGLAIRILGDITKEKVQLLQEADSIFIKALKESNLYEQVWQAGVILLPVQSVGVMGDERTYENAVALRAVGSTDGMTADWIHLPYDFLAKVSNDIINRVKGINRVVYDISSKPPATIEWE